MRSEGDYCLYLYFQGHSDWISQIYWIFREGQATERENQVGSGRLRVGTSISPEWYRCWSEFGEQSFVAKAFFQPAKRRLYLIGANVQISKGREWGQAGIERHKNEKQTNKREELQIRIVLHKAVIQDYVILSFSWFELRSEEILRKENGVLSVSKEQSVWVDFLGVQESDWSNNMLGVQTTTLQKPKEAFTCFVALKVLPNCWRRGVSRSLLWTLSQISPWYLLWVMNCECSRLPRRNFDVITMIHSCTKFSKAKSVGAWWALLQWSKILWN